MLHVRKLIFIGLLTATSCVASYKVNAQQYISLGSVAGIGHSSFSNTPYKSKFNPVFSAGLSFVYAKHKHWGLGIDVMYSREGAIYEWVSDDVRHRLHYFRIPLKAYYFLGAYPSKIRPKIYAGPSVGFNLGEDIDWGTNLITLPFYKQKAVDLGLLFGFGLNVKIMNNFWLNTDFNFYQGFVDATQYINSANLNQKFQLQVGILFGLSK